MAAPKNTGVQEDAHRVVGDVSSQHPELVAVLDDYREMRDTVEGSTAVKRAGDLYLPKPDGFTAQPDGGAGMYAGYRLRAQFPDIVAPTILGMVGIIHRREVKIEGMDEGSPLAGLWESATPDGLPLETLHRRLTEELLTVGRAGLLADAPGDGADLPWIALYQAEDVINWSADRDFFVLRESYRERTGFTWEARERFRVLELSDGTYTQRLLDESGSSLLPDRPAGTDDTTDGSSAVVVPTARGGVKLDEIPLVVAGSRDMSLKPDQIPLIGLARSALALYRLDADYRHQLFMSGQETFYTTGLDPKDAPKIVGAGVILSLPDGATAGYVSPSGEGIAAHRIAIQDERAVAAAAGAQILETEKRAAESGEALKIRARAASASIVSVALASAAALEQVLRHCARMVGQDPEDIVVVPSLDFIAPALTPQEAKDLMELWLSGVISYQTLYEKLQVGEIASQERTAEEEQEEIAQEESQVVDDEVIVDPAITDPPQGVV